jgi:glutamine amidotransferase
MLDRRAPEANDAVDEGTAVRVALIDYGAGNLTSVAKALAHVGLDVFRPHRARELGSAAAIVVPGVGHFAATAPLEEEFRAAILDETGRGKVLFGICLGLQWLFDGSDEAPEAPGLGLIRGRCFRLSGDVKVPHVGWNTLDVAREGRLLRGLDGAFAYFTHSYAAPITGEASALTTHGTPFASVVERGNVFGVQWHPEKSGETGLAVLRNFARAVRSC